MITDAPPRNGNRADFLESDCIKTLHLPEKERLPAIARSIESAMQTGKAADVRRACLEFLAQASDFYGTPTCSLRVLAARRLRVRERWTTELFGDYNPKTKLIRLWMRTAVRKEITSFGTILSTLCHEFCHHQDYQHFGFADSWHTRGSTSVLLSSTIMRGAHHRSGSFGYLSEAGGGGSTGQKRTEVGDAATSAVIARALTGNYSDVFRSHRQTLGKSALQSVQLPGWRKFRPMGHTKVVRRALRNAGSIAALMLTTETLVAEVREEKETSHYAGAGMQEC